MPIPVRMLLIGLFVACAATAQAAPKKKPASRTSILDEIWNELRTHDPFFDPDDPDLIELRREFARRLEACDDPGERLRELVRLLCHLGDGHTALHTRWFLPDKPPPPLPMAGDDPLYRPQISAAWFHRDLYLRLEFPEQRDEAGRALVEDCRVVTIDGAPFARGAAWDLLNGRQNTTVAIEVERPDGSRVKREMRRTQAVVPRKHWAPTTQRVVRPKTRTQPAETKTVEIVVRWQRLEGNLGYIHLGHLVTQQAVEDFHKALDELMDTDGLVLDLRNNHGGYPWIMMPIAGRFFSKYQKVASFDGRSPLIGPLVRAVGQVGIAPCGETYTKPMVVLIADGTASMGEGLAFSLGDTGRAVLIGRPTMGLNAAIRNVRLSNGLVLWHSWIRTNRLNGAHYQNIGVEPHERVELSREEVARLGIFKAAEAEGRLQFDHAARRLRELVEQEATQGKSKIESRKSK